MPTSIFCMYLLLGEEEYWEPDKHKESMDIQEKKK